ncbi:MAG: hypothetical protein ACLGIA_07705 [Actinomycetes bacterium]
MSADLFGTLVPGIADVDRVRSLARRADDLGCDLADCAARARSTASTDWRSVAADGFRAELAATSRAVESCAEGLEEASVALARHARTTEERLPR